MNLQARLNTILSRVSTTVTHIQDSEPPYHDMDDFWFLFLLFLLYVNDMASAGRCKLLLYADDSAVIASWKNVADIESTLSYELEYVSVIGLSITNCLFILVKHSQSCL